MVKIDCKVWDVEKKEYRNINITLDGYLKSNLDAGVEQLHKDFDQLWFIDGSEGSGKSELGKTCAFYVNRPETRHTLVHRICLTSEEFEKAINKAKKYEAVVLDEAFGSMSAAGAMSKINRLLTKKFTEIRAKNLFVFIIAPSFMDIQRYFALWRSKCLLHVYLGKNNQRGFCSFYSALKKRKLWILGKKQFYNYKVVSPNFIFRFSMQSKKFLDNDAYMKKKIQTMNDNATPVLTESQHRKQIIMEALQRADEFATPAFRKQLMETYGVSSTTISRYKKEMEEKVENP